MLRTVSTSRALRNGESIKVRKFDFRRGKPLTSSDAPLPACILSNGSAASNSALLQSTSLHLSGAVAEIFLTMLHEISALSNLLTKLKSGLPWVSNDIARQKSDSDERGDELHDEGCEDGSRERECDPEKEIEVRQENDE
jgi:hypothetical protein